MLPIKTILLSYLIDASTEGTANRLEMQRSEVARVIKENQPDLELLQTARNMRIGVDADWVLVELLKMYHSNLDEILNADGTIKPMKEWSPIWKTMISAFESKDIISKDGDKLGSSCKFNKPDALKLLEKIGDHIRVSAFTDNTLGKQGSRTDEVIDKMSAGRDRVFKGKPLKSVK